MEQQNYIMCKKCGKLNKDTNVKCEVCSSQIMSEEQIRKIQAKATIRLFNIIINTIFLPLLLMGVSSIGFGLFFNISQYYESKGYLKEDATLIKYENCFYEGENELCEAVYEYKVGDRIYTTSPNVSTEKENFKKFDTVYYNPNNPRESIIYVDFTFLFKTGFIMIALFAPILFIKYKIKKKLITIIDNMKK